MDHKRAAISGSGEREPATIVAKSIYYWRSLGLTIQFLLIATLIVCGSMAILGEWLSSQIAANQIQSRAESGALYMEGFLARHVEEPEGMASVSVKRQEELDELLIGTSLALRVEGFRIWRPDGTIIYSTDKSLMGKRLPSADIDRALKGMVVARLENGHDDEPDVEPKGHQPLIEIYAPIYRTGTKEVIAVGELYEQAEDFIALRNWVQRRTWTIVGITTIAIMALLFLVVRRASAVINSQRMTLKAQLANAQALANQNRNLRALADKARMDASKSNETLLNRIGSDLHDGPVQLLSLLILRLDTVPDKNVRSPTEGDTALDLRPIHLANQVLSELRELSTGLVLPEIENMSLENALQLAVERHEYATASAVEATYSSLPELVAHPLKICLYRVVQEGLNNAFRHAGAREQGVNASSDERFITVIVSDGGLGLQPASAPGRRHPLGLQGLRNRVEAFGGSVEVRQNAGAGTQLVATIPLDSNSA